jgi:hypothetical protein
MSGWRESPHAVDAEGIEVLATACSLKRRAVAGLVRDGNAEPLISLKGKWFEADRLALRRRWFK